MENAVWVARTGARDLSAAARGGRGGGGGAAPPPPPRNDARGAPHERACARATKKKKQSF